MGMYGLYTALITPFKDGNVDYDKINELVDLQLEAKVNGILPVGTTGESPTLSEEEQTKIIETVLNRVNGRCQVVAGTGTNYTAKAIEKTKKAKAIGVDACLLVTPYYNKPSQEGLYQHFSRIADVELPVILYNVPGRAGVPIEIDTVVRLSKHPYITAIKEAAGSVERVSMILDECDLTVFSGDDALTLPMMSVGAKGIISVISNLCPKPIAEMVDSYSKGDIKKAENIHRKYYRLMKAMFIETNPAPVKAALAKKGIINEEFRLPICPISTANKETLFRIMDECGC